MPKVVNQNEVLTNTRWGPGPMRSGTWGSPALPAPVQPNSNAPQMMEAVFSREFDQGIYFGVHHVSPCCAQNHFFQWEPSHSQRATLMAVETHPADHPQTGYLLTLQTQSHWPRWHQLWLIYRGSSTMTTVVDATDGNGIVAAVLPAAVQVSLATSLRLKSAPWELNTAVDVRRRSRMRRQCGEQVVTNAQWVLVATAEVFSCVIFYVALEMVNDDSTPESASITLLLARLALGFLSCHAVPVLRGFSLRTCCRLPSWCAPASRKWYAVGWPRDCQNVVIWCFCNIDTVRTSDSIVAGATGYCTSLGSLVYNVF